MTKKHTIFSNPIHATDVHTFIQNATDIHHPLALGDDNNDIEILQTVGYGIAIANASEKLKAVADDVCGHVAEDEIYHYCRTI